MTAQNADTSQRRPTPVWHVVTSGINEVLRAEDQFAAWDTFRDRPVEDFGLIVTAEADESADPLAIQTSVLMTRWGRADDAVLFVEAAIAAGLTEGPTS